MSDQFICISCWQEFAVASDDIEERGGKVVCPKCGYIQPLPEDADKVAHPGTTSTKLEDPTGDTPPDAAHEIPWTAVEEDDYEVPVGEEERTDRVELPKELLEEGGWDPSIGFEEEAADEKTPLETMLSLSDDAVLVEDTADDSELNAEGPSGEADWQLKTPSGLTFKFTDPEALLGWKKKISAYKQLQVSPDGARWVDFERFLRQYEELGDPLKAFILSEGLSEDEIPQTQPPVEEEQGEMPGKEEPAEEKPEPAEDSEEDASGRTETAQFTFKVQEKNSGFGRYLLYALLGLGLGAGIVVAALHFLGIFELPI